MKDLTNDLLILLRKIQTDVPTQESFAEILLTISLLNSWIVLLFNDGYSFILQEMLVRAVSTERNNAVHEEAIKKACSELQKFLSQYKDDAGDVMRSMTSFVLKYNLKLNENSLFAEHPEVAHLVENNQQYKDDLVRVMEVTEVNVEAFEVKQCRLHVLKAREVIAPKLLSIVEQLTHYFNCLYFTELDEIIVSHNGPSIISIAGSLSNN